MAELADTPDLSVAYCPVCEPERDPSREVLRAYHCSIHEPSREGLDDAGVPDAWTHLSGSVEAEASVCRKMAEVLGRPR